MSGRKRITVDESEWFRLQQQASRFKEVSRDLPQLIEDVRRQTRADLDRTFAGVEERNRRTEQLVGSLSEHTRRLEADTTARLNRQARQAHQALAATAGELRQETRGLLAAQRDALHGEIADERAERRAEAARLAEQLQQLAADHAQAERTARTWLADGEAMVSLIRETLPHDRFAPGRLASLEARLSTVGQNISGRRFDAALALAQESFHALGELRVELSRLDLEHRVAGAAATEALLVVEKLVTRNAVLPVRGPDGDELPDVALDVDHWTRGELTTLREEIDALRRRVADDGLGTEELLALATGTAPALQERLGETVERAGMRQLASQLRVNLADAVARTLDLTAGYELTGGEYADSDEREAFYAKLTHQNGNEIVLDIAPVPGDTGECVLRILSYDRDTTSEAERNERTRAVREALRAEGHHAAAPVAESGGSAPAATEPAYVQLGAEPAPHRTSQA